jgi:pSer/pThr/pTyr-binding forkhead associated (FHA) protein
MYKYNCRKCPIRNRCIDESENSSSVKSMLRHAFEARTDTLKAWGRLQRNCLLEKAEEERAKKGSTGSLLKRRLQEVRDSKKTSNKVIRPLTKKPDYLNPVSADSKSSERPKLKPLTSSSKSQPSEPTRPSAGRGATPSWAYSSDTPVPDTITDRTVPPPQKAPERLKKAEPARPHWLIVADTDRHVSLPVDGELVFGRFDPHIGIPPDVDLSYEDRGVNGISRRHARIVGVEGRHTLEDLGSRQGVFINGKQIESGVRRPLKSGDRIAFGKTYLLYDAIPTHMLIISPDDQVKHQLTVTPTGRQVPIEPPADIVIGRADAYVDFKPDIDLKQDGEAAARVSRRHAIITWRNRIPYLEDLGSGLGTRLNGKMLLMGQAVQLKPGDHIWLGGCVLAYDVIL